MKRRGFTLIELLVVIAIIALLIGILLPSLGAARKQAKVLVCGTRLQQLGVGLTLYLNDHDETLPQQTAQGFDGNPTIVGALFGGKKGQLPFLGINEYGAERRPLNAYVISQDVPPDDSNETIELEAFKSPIDKGGENLGVPGFERADSMYDLIGSSYTLNDHALDTNPFGDDYPTLVPERGGKMPFVVQPDKTWVLATHPIYNYDDGGSQLNHREQYWFTSKQIEANLICVDMHAELRALVPPGQVNTTDRYTFLPSPKWIDP